MPADIVNLHRARKAKARTEQEKQASENRVKFGRTKAEREAAKGKAAIDEKRLEAHRVTRPDALSAPDGAGPSNASSTGEQKPDGEGTPS